MMLIVVWGGFVFELWSQIWDLDTFLRLKRPECERATECQLPTVANNNYFYLLLENAQILQFIFLFTIICKDEQFCNTLETVQFVHDICIVYVILYLYLSMLFCICMYCTLTNICGSTQGVTCLSPWRVSGRFLRNHLKQDLGQSSKFFLFDTFYHRIG